MTRNEEMTDIAGIGAPDAISQAAGPLAFFTQTEFPRPDATAGGEIPIVSLTALILNNRC